MPKSSHTLVSMHSFAAMVILLLAVLEHETIGSDRGTVVTAGEELVLGQLIEITGMTGGVGETFEGNCKAADSPNP